MPDHEPPIDVIKTTLGGALRNGPLKIPNYQREYSWKPDRVRKLFDDFHNAMIKQHKSYFLGTIVLTPGNPPDVIDGQQRLATTSIFLSAMRDEMIQLNEERDAKSIDDFFLFMYDRHMKENIPRLTLNTDDREYMMARVLLRPKDRKGKPVPRLHSHRLIDRAAEIAADRVRKIVDAADTQSRKMEALNAWIDFVDQSAIIVMLKPPNVIRAYQMFKTLNDRAQRTTQADMIKNHLFEQAEDRVDEAQSKWSTMRSTIEGVSGPRGDDPLLTYLHHISIVFNGPIKSDDIFEKMEQTIVGRSNSLTFLEALANYANDYSAIVTPTHAKWSQYDKRVSINVNKISQEIGMSFIRPLMLAVATRFSPAETNRAFRMLVAWAVRFLVAGGSRGGVVEKAFGDAAHAIGTGRVTTAQGLADMAVHAVPSDSKFYGSFRTKTLSNGKQARFILEELEAHVRGVGPDSLVEPTNDPSTLSLEHILPKNPSAKKGWEHFKDDQRNFYSARLGNLVLLHAKDNGAIGDKPFPVKRPVIEKSKSLKLTDDVITRTEGTDLWTPGHIKARQDWMAGLALERWPLRLS